MAIAAPKSWYEPPPFPVRRFTVAEYHRMIEAGVLGEEDAVELLEGWIVPKMPRNPRHDATIELATVAISQRLPAGWRVRAQCAVTTRESEPEPDLAVVRGNPRDFLKRHPGPDDVAAIVEVSDSSLAHDRTLKCRAYARAGIRAYWIINLVDSVVEVYSSPSGNRKDPKFNARRDFHRGETVSLSLDKPTELQIPVDELLP